MPTKLGSSGVSTPARQATLALAPAAQEIPVEFETPLSAPPKAVQGLVIKPDAESDDVFVVGLVGEPSAFGCTFRLSAPVPASGYKLSYFAS